MTAKYRTQAARLNETFVIHSYLFCHRSCASIAARICTLRVLVEVWMQGRTWGVRVRLDDDAWAALQRLGLGGLVSGRLGTVWLDGGGMMA